MTIRLSTCRAARPGRPATRLGLLVLATASLGLAACEKEVRLEGERFPVRAPLDASVPVEGEPAPVAPNPAEGYRSEPISLPGQSANADWPQRGGNAAHTGSHGRLSAAPARVWSASVGGGNTRRARITAEPVVSGGTVFAMGSNGTVSALDLASGGQLWQASAAPEGDRGALAPGGGLAVSAGKVIVTTGAGEVVALSAADGTVAWRQRLDGPAAGAPAVDGGAAYVVSRDGVASAIDLATGKLRWQLTATRTTAGVQSPAAPAISGDLVIVPYETGQLLALNAPDGTRAWAAAVAGQRNGRAYAAYADVTGDPVVAGGVAYVGSAGGRMVAVEAETGQRLWGAGEGAMNAPLVVGGSVFAATDDGRLVRLDATTGETIWAVDMPYFTAKKTKKNLAIVAHYGPVLAGGHLVVASSDGQLRMFSPTDGALVGGAEIPGGAASAPVLAGGMLLVMGGNGQIHAFR